MEVHPAYAVVLDEEGRFLKAANLRYQVGDTVRDIVELRRPKEKRPALWKPLSGVAGLAACLCLVFFGYYQPNFVPLRRPAHPDQPGCGAHPQPHRPGVGAGGAQ